MNYIIGAGGVGSWLLPAVCLLKKPENVTVLDGDILEQKNLNRQLFTEADIGLNKAEALSNKYRCYYRTEYFAMGLLRLSRSDTLLVCADNNPARLAALQEADVNGCFVVIGANETTSSEAYVYRQQWRGTNLDPREYYKELVTVHTGDPFAERVGCTGEDQERNVQLVTANMMAAALMAHLFMVWTMKAPELERETISSLPHKLVCNMTRMESFKATIERTT